MTHLHYVADKADDDFKTLRRYTRQEAAAMLGARDSWLKRWVTADVVPHQRSGKPGPHQRGVWFTYDDILATGALMPTLMSGRQANSRAEGKDVGHAPDPDRASKQVESCAEVTASVSMPAEVLDAYRHVVSLRAPT